MMGANPKLYREMQEPYESSHAAADAFSAFVEDVGVAREKHRMSQVLTVCVLRALTGDGEEGEVFVSHYYGDHNTAVAMAACAYGELSKEQKDHISKLLAGEVRRQKTRK